MKTWRPAAFFAGILLVLGVLLLQASAPVLAAGTVGLTTVGTAYTQNFDTLVNTGTGTSIPNGWYFTEIGTGANITYTAGTGSGNAGDTYSFGATGGSDRAFGMLLSGSVSTTLGANFINNTGVAITSLAVGYTGEMWRAGVANRGAADRIDFQISTDATSPTTGTWTDVNNLDFSSPVPSVATAGALDGNSAANRTALSYTISGLNIANGAGFWIRWTDYNIASSDDGLAVDDFSLTPNPPAVMLSINDVSVTEGNSGTTLATFTVSLSGPAPVGGVTFDIATQDNNATTGNNDYTARSLTGQTIAQGNTTFTFVVTVNGDTTAEGNETFYVNVTNVVGVGVNDGQGVGTITNDDATRIRDIQGSAHISPLNGLTVTNVPGIVTAVRANGFYLQDPSPDADDATSEGIFVFTSTTPPATAAVGNSVTVNGTVSEYRSGTNGLTLTEITGPTVTLVLSGNALPAAIVLGTGGRVPPSTVINTGTCNVESSCAFNPAGDGIDFYESLEGMYVQINNAVVVGPRSDFTTNREIPVIGDGGANASVRTTRGGVIIRSTDYNPERLILNDWITGASPLPAANVGDTFATVVGVIDYNFDNYKLEVTTLPTLVSGGLAQETTTAQTGSQFSIATFNVENLDSSDGGTKFSGLANLIVNNLKSPDIIAVEEVQDNNGATNDAVVDASTTWNTLINAITSAGGPTYQYRDINPVDDQDGGEPGGNIRQGFLYRTDRGLAFVDRGSAGSTTANSVINNAGVPQLQYSPGRIDPTNAAFNASRKPLIGEFTFGGSTIFVIANHWNSKGGDQPLYGPNQPPTLSSETQRNQQATIVRDFVVNILAIDSNARVVVLGDLNDFEFSNPLTTIKNSGMMTDLVETLAPGERYSYVYQGNSQALEHILVSGGLAAKRQRVDVVHANAEFATRWSDHDPMVAVFDLTAPTAVTLSQFGAQATDARVNIIVLFGLVGAGAGTALWLGKVWRKRN